MSKTKGKKEPSKQIEKNQFKGRLTNIWERHWEIIIAAIAALIVSAILLMIR